MADKLDYRHPTTPAPPRISRLAILAFVIALVPPLYSAACLIGGRLVGERLFADAGFVLIATMFVGLPLVAYGTAAAAVKAIAGSSGALRGDHLAAVALVLCLFDIGAPLLYLFVAMILSSIPFR